MANPGVIDEVVGIELKVADFGNDPESAVTRYFDAIKRNMENAGDSMGKIVSTWQERLEKIIAETSRRGLASGRIRTGLDNGASQIQSVLENTGFNLLTKWANSGDLSHNLFMQHVVPRGDIRQLRRWLGNGLITQDAFDQFSQNARNNQPPSPPSPPKDFKARWDDAALSVGRLVLSLKALEAPFKVVYRFTDQLREVNLQFALMAQNANMAASSLAAQSGVFAAFGGSGRGFANYAHSFAIEMERRRIGLGDGGKFTQALMHYGIAFNPNDLEATTRNIVAFMSNPNRTDAQKLMAGQMLGWDGAMIAAAKRGNAFYEQYTAEMKGLTTHKDPAAEAAMELSLETNKLKAAFQDLKDQIFTDLAPYISLLVQGLTKVCAFLNDNEWITKILEASAALFVAAKSLALVRITGGAAATAWGAIMRLLGGGGEAAEAATASAGSGISGAGGGIAGGMSGSSAKAFGALGKVAKGNLLVAAVDAVAGGIQRQIQIHSLSKLEIIVEQWHNEWVFFWTSWGKISKSTREHQAQNFGVDGLILQSGENFRKALEGANANMPPIVDGEVGHRSVVVSSLSINVTSNASDATGVADEIRKVIMDEFSVLAYEGGGEVA